MLLTFFIFIFSLVGLYLYTHHGHKTHKALERCNRKKSKSSNNSKSATNNEFHCVETHHHAQCCEAVKELHGKRFLSAEAPALPISGCDQAHCHCDYIHHDDRRTDVRRDGIGLQHHMYGQNGETEHREPRRGRRKND